MCRIFSDKNPSFDVIVILIFAMGIELSESVKGEPKAAGVLAVKRRAADGSCGEATLRTSPSSGQAATSSCYAPIGSLPAT